METKITCPICHNKAEYTSFAEDIGIVEEYTRCPVCGYRDEMAYGYYLVVVGNKTFSWSYRLEGNNCIRLFKKLNRAKFAARRNWKKFRKKTLPRNCQLGG